MRPGVRPMLVSRTGCILQSAYIFTALCTTLGVRGSGHDFNPQFKPVNCPKFPVLKAPPEGFSANDVRVHVPDGGRGRFARAAALTSNLTPDGVPDWGRYLVFRALGAAGHYSNTTVTLHARCRVHWADFRNMAQRPTRKVGVFSRRAQSGKRSKKRTSPSAPPARTSGGGGGPRRWSGLHLPTTLHMWVPDLGLALRVRPGITSRSGADFSAPGISPCPLR
eukprot:7381557-Prymnesium_polylepis.1